MTVLEMTAPVATPDLLTSVVERGEVGMAADLRRWSFVAIGLLGVLNVADVVLTKRFMSAGLTEGNPLMAGLVQDWRMGAVKALILGGLFLKAVTSRPSVARACLLWAGVGVYALASYVNWQALQQIPV